MKLSDFDYKLPADRIAQHPVKNRDSSQLMVLNKDAGIIAHRVFSDLPLFLKKDDLLVLNDTKVFPARLTGIKHGTGAEIEILLLRSLGNGTWQALSRPAKRLRQGAVVSFGEGLLTGTITGKDDGGYVTISFQSSEPVDTMIDRLGATPLPPYINRMPDESDRDRYQTVFAEKRGSSAAPTAGLHFTRPLLRRIDELGIQRAFVTLHVGTGTFRPLTENEVSGSVLSSEYCLVPPSTAKAVRDCRARGGRVIACGTTTVRAIETASTKGVIEPFEGWTELFIKPSFTFHSVDSLITNFHLPRSSLLILVCAFAGKELIFNAYHEAVSRGYRFYSYGDAMLITGGLS